MQKLNIPYAEFYITNVCNLACQGCNRFNNYNFTGYQKWSDYQEVYKQWSEQVNLGSIGLLGGEPMFNPTFLDWVNGIAELWPRATLRIITNAFRLDRIDNFYNILKNNRHIQLWVGIHNKQHKQLIINKVKDFLQEPIQVEFHGENPYQEYLVLTDANNIQVRVEYNWWFHQGAIIKQDNQLTLHNSNPVKAHKICHMNSCHHFIKGKLYKCGVAAVLPDFDQQHTLTLSKEDKELLYAYRPLAIDDSIETKQLFVKNLMQPIDQCKFCPEEYHGEQIYAQLKKDIK